MKKLSYLILVLVLMFSINVFATERTETSNSISVDEKNPIRIIDFEIEVEELPIEEPSITPPIEPEIAVTPPVEPIPIPKPPVKPIDPPKPVEQPVKPIDPPKPVEKLGIIKGYVLTEKREPIAQARLSLNGTDFTTYTDENGYFEFDQVALGTHRVYLSHKNLSPDLVLLKAITVKEDNSLSHKLDGKEFINKSKATGSAEAASVALTEEKTAKTLEMVVELKVKGKIIVKYLHNQTLLEQEEFSNLDMGIHKVTAKDFIGYTLAEEQKEKEITLTEDIPEKTVIVEFNYDIIPVAEKGLPIIPFIAAGFIFLVILLLPKQHIVIYSISSHNGKEILTRLGKKKVKFVKDDIVVDISKELILADELPLRVVFLKTISRRIGDKTIILKDKEQPVYSFLFPLKINKKYSIDIKQ